MTLNEILQKKGAAVKQYRDLLDKASAEGRELTADESRQLDCWEKEIDEANASIERMESAKRRASFLSQAEASLRQPVMAGVLQTAGNDGENTKPDTRTLIEKLRDFTDEGMTRQEALDRIAAENNDQAKARRQVVDRYLRTGNFYGLDPRLMERAALQQDNATQAGFLLMPDQFVARLIQDLDASNVIRNLATVYPLMGGESLQAPSLDTDIADTGWVTELNVGSADTALAFGRRSLTPHPLAQYILVSKDLLRAKTAISPEAIVRERMSFKFGAVQETAFMTGSGAQRPLGLFTATSLGISTSRDVSTGNTTTEITADGLIECKYSFTSPWMTRPLTWLFHRTAVKQIRLIKDGNGQYIWKPGLSGDGRDTILDYPVVVSEYAPSTFTTGQYVGILGDFSYYWIVDAYTLEIQRLVELHAGTNQDGFYGRMKTDGMPVLQTAFARVKLG